MSVNLLGRNFLKEVDFTPEEFHYLLDLSSRLKTARRAGTEQKQLIGKTVALVFEKASTRTRCAFEVAAYHQGASVTYLDPASSHLGSKESTKDTARVLGRLYDGIEYRGAHQATIEALARHAGVPVWNGLTNEWHPTQMLADFLTMREHSAQPLSQITVAYCGDARNNIGNSLLVAGAMFGCDIRLVGPRPLWTQPAIVRQAENIAQSTGARISQTEDVTEGVRNADFLYTDVWVSLGEAPEVWVERLELLLPYQVDSEMIQKTENPDVKFMHCLPALHNSETDLGAEICRSTGLNGVEVTDEIFESPRSIVFDQAENRLHTIKAIMVATLAGEPLSHVPD